MIDNKYRYYNILHHIYWYFFAPTKRMIHDINYLLIITVTEQLVRKIDVNEIS